MSDAVAPGSLMRRKPIESLIAQSEGGVQLKRTLGPFGVVALGIGCIIGAGLFSLTGIAAANNAGPAVTLSYVFAAIGCGFAGLCYSELASMIPVAGSAYTYAYATMGELVAWIIGWDLVLEYAVGAATVATSWSSYLNKLLHEFGMALPPRLCAAPFEPVRLADGTMSTGMINLPAIFVIVMISLLLMRGITESSRVNNTIVVIKVAIVLAVIGFGVSYINTANYVPFVPANTGTFGHFGWSGVMRGAGVIFFAFIGFDAVSTAAQETYKPQRDMPIGILGSLAVCTVLYILFSLVLTGIVNYKEFLHDASPVATAIGRTPYPWLRIAVNIGILCGYTSVILVLLLGQSRVFYAMSRDGLLPKFFSQVHPSWQTPWRCNALFMVLAGALAGLLPISTLGEMTSIGTLLAFCIVCGGVMLLRRQGPGLTRAFRTPWSPLIPILGILSCAAMMLSLDGLTWIRLGVWMAIGLVVYFTYGRFHAQRALER
jgi:APA family basic amino acid/polyamine antiporter